MCASLLPIHLTASVKRRGSIRLLAQRRNDDDDDNLQNASGLFLYFKISVNFETRTNDVKITVE